MELTRYLCLVDGRGAVVVQGTHVRQVISQGGRLAGGLLRSRRMPLDVLRLNGNAGIRTQELTQSVTAFASADVLQQFANRMRSTGSNLR